MSDLGDQAQMPPRAVHEPSLWTPEEIEAFKARFLAEMAKPAQFVPAELLEPATVDPYAAEMDRIRREGP